jgi:RNA polymerase sigma-70 factor (ECF subfamily)
VLSERARRDLEAAYREWGADMWRAVFAYSGGVAEVADEAVAEAFAQAAARLESVRDLRPWLFTAAFRIAAGELQRRRRAAPFVDTGTVALDGSDVELLDLVGRLPPRRRAAFALREVLGFTTRETAELLGASEVAIRVRLHAARRRLRSQLNEEEHA